MTKDDRFKPRFEKPSRDRVIESSFTRELRKEVARLKKPRPQKGGPRAKKVRGALPGRMAQIRAQRFDPARMRRVVVKVHISRATRAGGPKAFRTHVNYIERDGVAHDGSRGQAYDKSNDQADSLGFKSRSMDDARQFRLIVSPEDGAELKDLKGYVRDVMKQVERALDTKLDWIAVNHHDTGLPHAHVVIRGRDDTGDHLAIDRTYLTEGIRRVACEQVLDRLGPRSELEVLRKQALEIETGRLTEIDRRLAARANDNVIDLPPSQSIREEVGRSLEIRRLKYLKTLRLAERDGHHRWVLKPGWQDSLKAMGQQRDIIREVAAQWREHNPSQRIDSWSPEQVRGPVIARVVASGFEDELTGTRWIAAEALNGRVWKVGVGDTAPPIGAVVELKPREARTLPSDRTIARVASLNGGRWSEDIHAAHDPEATSAYITAHKRRLEALRRAGVVTRDANGIWTVGDDYLDQAAIYEARRENGVILKVKAERGLEGQARLRGLSFLEEVETGATIDRGFGGEVSQAKFQRISFLLDQGYLGPGETQLPPAARSRLADEELNGLADAEARRSGRTFHALGLGNEMQGTLERIIETGQGRLGLVGDKTHFTLVPMRSGMDQGLGRELHVKRRTHGIDWELGRGRGLGR